MTTMTAADGTYVLDIETYWRAEVSDGTDAFVTVDGVLVDFVENFAPDSATTVDYRVGRTPIFEAFASDLDIRGDGSLLVDLLRKVNKDGTSEWAACSDWACTGAVFGTKKTELLGLTPIDAAVGSAFIVLRDTTGGVSSWLRIEPDTMFADQATFGPKRLDGFAYFDFQGDGPRDLVAWADRGGETTIWTWATYDGLAGVDTIVAPGRFVSADHLDLDGNGVDEMVVVTHKGRTYTVYSIASSISEPVVVASGRGEPTVTYTDPDSDGVLDVVAVFG